MKRKGDVPEKCAIYFYDFLKKKQWKFCFGLVFAIAAKRFDQWACRIPLGQRTYFPSMDRYFSETNK